MNIIYILGYYSKLVHIDYVTYLNVGYCSKLVNNYYSILNDIYIFLTF